MTDILLNVFYVLVAIAMIVLILLQRGAGAQAGSGFGAGLASGAGVACAAGFAGDGVSLTWRKANDRATVPSRCRPQSRDRRSRACR